MERSDWLIRKLGGWSEPPPQRAVKGLYGQTRDAVIGRIKMTSSPWEYIMVRSGKKEARDDGYGQVSHTDQRDD